MQNKSIVNNSVKIVLCIFLLFVLVQGVQAEDDLVFMVNEPVTLICENFVNGVPHVGDPAELIKYNNISWETSPAIGSGITDSTGHVEITFTEKYPGTYYYKFHFGSGAWSNMRTARVLAYPVAAFTATPLQGPVPLTVKFTDLSTGDDITSRVWQYQINGSSGTMTTFTLDGASSYKFNYAGSYDIKLTIKGTGGSSSENRLRYVSVGCDFSTQPATPQSASIERCFGGVGSGCSGNAGRFAPFTPNQNTCKVSGTMSVGSILHDNCCVMTDNAGYSCLKINKGTRECYDQWKEAWYNTQCSAIGSPRQWSATFGPYWFGNTGDFGDVPKADLSAPSGTRVKPVYQYLCSSGSCRVDKNGNTILEKDGCGQYCVCK